jgi:IMP dehydrogenase/GMP reductase
VPVPAAAEIVAATGPAAVAGDVLTVPGASTVWVRG